MDQEKIGKFISKLRKEKNLTQEQLAIKMGVSINAVSKWERGLSFPDVSLFKKLCNELDISIEELINGERDNSDEAKEKAIINTIKLKEKIKKKSYFIVSILLIVISLLIISSILIYKKNLNKQNEVDKYYERNYKMTFIARDIEANMKYRNSGNYPSYYGGMYISDDAYNIILLIVKDKIPYNTIESYYYNELISLDKSIKIKYVDNSYSDLLDVYNKLNDYITNNDFYDKYNYVYIDMKKNKVIVNYSLTEFFDMKDLQDFDLNLVEFEQGITKEKGKCINYPKELGEKILENHSNSFISIQKVSSKYIPVILNLYEDGTYELFTTYQACPPGKFCTSILRYLRSIKGKYNYDIKKIIENSTNADNMSFNMNNLPEYEIYLSEKYMEEYDSDRFVVEKGRKNIYLEELLNQIDIDLSLCAKPEYINAKEEIETINKKILNTKKIVIKETYNNDSLKTVSNPLEVNELINIIKDSKINNTSIVSFDMSNWSFYMYDSYNNLISVIQIWKNGRVIYNDFDELYSILPSKIDSINRIINSGLN